MGRLARIQLVGPCALLIAVMAADAAAYALAQHPSSAFLWYLNLDFFSVFRKSRAALGEFGGVPFAQALILGGPLALAVLAGTLLRKNFCLAVASNLALVFGAFVAYSWLMWGRAGAQSASLVWATLPSNGTATLLAVLALTSIVSFFASHLIYFMALRSRAQ
jgi:hypothetical protein